MLTKADVETQLKNLTAQAQQLEGIIKQKENELTNAEATLFGVKGALQTCQFFLAMADNAEAIKTAATAEEQDKTGNEGCQQQPNTSSDSNG